MPTNNIKQVIVEKAVNKYLKLNKEERQNTLILTPANETRITINNILRAELRKEFDTDIQTNKNKSLFDIIKNKFIKNKELTDININVLQQKSLTEVEKKDINNYQLNNKIIFNKDYNTYNIEKIKNTVYRILIKNKICY